MAKVIVTLKIMPESPDIKLDKIQEQAKRIIADFGGDVGKVEEKPIAFGLKALYIIFIMDESKGSTETLEDSVSEIEGVKSVEVTDVRRAVG